MIAYDAQLYTFLTRPENFEPFIDLSEQYNKVKQRLVNEFWMLVLEEAQKLKPKKMLWEFGIEDVDARWRKLFARHLEISDNNLNAAILYENLDDKVVLGAWFDRSNKRFTEYNRDENYEYLRSNPTTKGDYSWIACNRENWCAIYKYPGLNFSQKASLLQILPHVREPLAKFYASLLISAVEQLGSFVLKNAKKA